MLMCMLRKKLYVLDLFHNKFEHVFQPFDEGNFMEDILCDTHHLSGSLKKDREKLMASMNNLVDINALVEICCWKASRGNIEG